MATTEMTLTASLNDASPLKGEHAWEYREALTGSTAGSDSILIPYGVSKIGIQLVVSASGTAKVQRSVDLISNIQASTNSWIDWTEGDITSSTITSFTMCTAVRQVNATGTSVLTVRCQ